MILPWLRAARHAVVAIAQSADLLAPALGADDVKATKQIIEKTHQVFGCLVRAHLREADDVSEQNRHTVHLAHVEAAELQCPPEFGGGRAFHHLLRHLRGHKGMDHLLLQLFLLLQVLPQHDGLTHLEEGAPTANLRHDEDVHPHYVKREVKQHSTNGVVDVKVGHEYGGQDLVDNGVEHAENHTHVQLEGNERIDQQQDFDGAGECPNGRHRRVVIKEDQEATSA